MCMIFTKNEIFYRNKIMDLTRLHFLNFCEQLQNLSLSGCPVAKIENFEKKVRNILPNINQFNGNQTLGKPFNVRKILLKKNVLNIYCGNFN